MRKKVTLKQLARELNLSVSTVSKSLRNDSEISAKTMHRVHELAQLYNYKPNALAVSLKSNKTKTIGVILPEILNHFFAKVLYGIEQEASSKGYKIVTCITNESYEKEVEYLEMLNYSSVDGFIVALSQETQLRNTWEHYQALLEEQIPIVLFDRVTEHLDCDKVIVDDKEASKNAVCYLIERGCKNIGIITTIADLNVADLRSKGVEEVELNSAMSFRYFKLSSTKLTDIEIEFQIKEFLKANKLDAVLGLDETAAAVTINVAHSLGYQIPKDISVIGFTDGLLSKYSYPKLTTISQHAERLGSRAAKVLMDRLERQEEKYSPITEVLKTSLIIRESTK